MKQTLILLSLTLGLSLALNAAETVRYDSQPAGGKITLEGKSSAGVWTMECAAIGGFIEADAAFPESAAGKPKIEVNVPVRQIKSGKKAMDARMLSEMNQPVHPRIEYRVLELKPKGAAGGGKAEFDATGTLTIVGVTRTNTMPVTITRVDKTKLKVNGAATVKMSDHGLKPPVFEVLGVGLMKTEDDVKVTFEWSPEVEKK